MLKQGNCSFAENDAEIAEAAADKETDHSSNPSEGTNTFQEDLNLISGIEIPKKSEGTHSPTSLSVATASVSEPSVSAEILPSATKDGMFLKIKSFCPFRYIIKGS